MPQHLPCDTFFVNCIFLRSRQRIRHSRQSGTVTGKIINIHSAAGYIRPTFQSAMRKEVKHHFRLVETLVFYMPVNPILYYAHSLIQMLFISYQKVFHAVFLIGFYHFMQSQKHRLSEANSRDILQSIFNSGKRSPVASHLSAHPRKRERETVFYKAFVQTLRT